MKETEVKRNLYYEIKDKILEETVEGGKIIRRSRKTKVFGLQSTKDVRDQLIELLMERVRHHKDKFISPTIYEEMRGLEVQKNGRVNHSELTHDDQIFSYLLAMYVWYYGKNLRENFGIQKMGIKTEDSVDDVVDFSGSEDVGSIIEEMIPLTRDNQDPLNKQLMQMNLAKGMMFHEYVDKQKKNEEERLQVLLQNPAIREAYARHYGIKQDMITAGQDSYGTNVRIPDSLFLDFNKDLSEMNDGSIYYTLNHAYMNNRYNVEENEAEQ